MNQKFRSAFSSLFSRLQGFGQLAWPYKATVVAVVIGIVFALLPQSLFHSFTCETINIRQNYQSSNRLYMDGQLVITGTRVDVDSLIATSEPPVTPETPATPVTPVTPVTPSTPVVLATPVIIAPPPQSTRLLLNLIEDCDLSYLNTRRAPNSDGPIEPRDRVLRLYEIPENSGLTVEGAINLINAARGDPDSPKDIFADPNYIASLLDYATDTCSLPNSDGSGGGGKDFGDPDILDLRPADVSNTFMNQWAFVGNQGIKFTGSHRFTGREVRVGVFDTSPFRTPHPLLRRIGIALPSPLWLTSRDAAGTPLTSTHGLYVAGLIHAIAPNASIQLIRVLDDEGCTESLRLAQALHAYISRMSAWTRNLEENVINMSLGIYTNGNNLPPYSLEDAITKADDLGAIIIAAAGNESEEPALPAKEMLYPAKYNNVLGVAASNPSGELACYSNKGDVSAPGGEGGPVTLMDADGTTQRIDCGPRADTWNGALGPYGGPACTDPTTCAYGLISLAQIDTGEYSYSFWAGTSFAAPLVSGLAALAYEEGEKDQVLCLIGRGVSPLVGGAITDPTNMGIINITESLSSVALSDCGITP